MKHLTNILLLLMFSVSAFAQKESALDVKSDRVNVYFDHDGDVVKLDSYNNREALTHFAEMFDKLRSDSLATITRVEINGTTSPEGDCIYNKKLSERRTNAIYDYLTNKLLVPDSLISRNHSGADWDGLENLVEKSDMEYKNEVLEVLRTIPEETWQRVKPTDRWMTLVDSRNKHLMDLRCGNPYRYMFANIYPKLRNGSVVTLYFKRELPPVIEELQEEVAIVEKSEQEQEIKQEQEIEQESIGEVEPASKTIVKPLFAIKTNLLFDAATLLNVEAEVPIGNRWSVAGEWIFPWWTWDDGTSESSRNRIQLLQGNVMGKYWFGDRGSLPQMTGWFAGVYVGAGLYDFERNRDGIQGEFFIAGGLAGGYAHTINKSGNLRMEYSLGIGYLQTDYRSYTAEYYGENDWRAIRTSTGKYSWIGPTQAKISLVWMLNHKAKKGGVR